LKNKKEAEVKKTVRAPSAYILTGDNSRRVSGDFIDDHAEPPPVASVADLGIQGRMFVSLEDIDVLLIQLHLGIPFQIHSCARSRNALVTTPSPLLIRHASLLFLPLLSPQSLISPIAQGYEMPEDMDESHSDKEEDTKKKGGIYADVDFNRPLEPHENLPVQQHRIVVSAPTQKEEPASSSKRSKDSKRRSRRHRDKDGKHREKDKGEGSRRSRHKSRHVLRFCSSLSATLLPRRTHLTLRSQPIARMIATSQAAAAAAAMSLR